MKKMLFLILFLAFLIGNLAKCEEIFNLNHWENELIKNVNKQFDIDCVIDEKKKEEFYSKLFIQVRNEIGNSEPSSGIFLYTVYFKYLCRCPEIYNKLQEERKKIELLPNKNILLICYLEVEDELLGEKNNSQEILALYDAIITSGSRWKDWAEFSRLVYLKTILTSSKDINSIFIERKDGGFAFVPEQDKVEEYEYNITLNLSHELISKKSYMNYEIITFQFIEAQRVIACHIKSLQADIEDLADFGITQDEIVLLNDSLQMAPEYQDFLSEGPRWLKKMHWYMNIYRAFQENKCIELIQSITKTLDSQNIMELPLDSLN